MVTNPTGGPHKTEAAPGGGVLVGEGEYIVYEIEWKNNQGKNIENVTITDPLDQGVDFVAAKFGTSDWHTWKATGPETQRLTKEKVDGLTDDNDSTAWLKSNTAGGKVSSAELTDGAIGPAEAVTGAEGTISYNETSRTVTWSLDWTGVTDNTQANGKVTLIVKVNDQAAEGWAYLPGTDLGTSRVEDDYHVVDRARVWVDDSYEFTEEVENPVPEKEEVQPKDGDRVKVGDKLTYTIHWANDAVDAEGVPTTGTVTVTDPLDIGVYFVSASYGELTLEEGDGSVNGQVGGMNVTISYDGAAHEVKWEFTNVPPEQREGDVTLTVQVNKYADEKWDYNPNDDKGSEGDGKDYKVYDRAVVVTNRSHVRTETVENPTGKPQKTETGPGDGKMVKIGDYITYEIDWVNNAVDVNGNPVAATVVVRDPLDIGVDFVAARFGPNEGGRPITDESMLVSGEWLKAGSPKENVNSGSRLSGGTISYTYSSDATKTVQWTLNGMQAANAYGTVTLVVKVNDRAFENWGYDSPDAPNPSYRTGEDNMVYDRAGIVVNHGSTQYTDIVENPLPKTE